MIRRIFSFFVLLGLSTTMRGCFESEPGANLSISVQPSSAVVGAPVVVSVQEYDDAKKNVSATGSVTIESGEPENASSCEAKLVNGYGHCTITFSKAGAYNISAWYPGDSNFPNTKNTRFYTVVEPEQPTPVKTADFKITIPPSPLLVGESISVSVDAYNTGTGIPEGIVNVTAEGTSCKVTLVNGKGSCDLSFSTGGEKQIKIAYPTQGEYEAFETFVSVTIFNPTTLTITSDHNPSYLNGNVTFTVTVTSTVANAVPTGYVTLSSPDSSSRGQTCDIELTGGTGTCSLFFDDTLAAKTYELTGEYSFSPPNSLSANSNDADIQWFVDSTATYGQVMQRWIYVATEAPSTSGSNSGGEGEIGCMVVVGSGVECQAPCPAGYSSGETCTVP